MVDVWLLWFAVLWFHWRLWCPQCRSSLFRDRPVAMFGPRTEPTMTLILRSKRLAGQDEVIQFTPFTATLRDSDMAAGGGSIATSHWVHSQWLGLRPLGWKDFSWLSVGTCWRCLDASCWSRYLDGLFIQLEHGNVALAFLVVFCLGEWFVGNVLYV